MSVGKGCAERSEADGKSATRRVYTRLRFAYLGYRRKENSFLLQDGWRCKFSFFLHF